MARMRTIADRAEQLLGTPVVATTPIAGGDVCTATRLRLSDGRMVLVKTRPYAPADFFAAEARGLRWLGEPPHEAGALPTPGVLAVEEDCLIIDWVEPARPTPESAAEFGRGLAVLHDFGAESYGAGADGFIAVLPLPNGAADSWPEFFATRRILPYLKLAVDRGNIEASDAKTVEDVVRRITRVAGPDEAPSRIHGDLWSGNVVWGAEPRATLIDPAAHGGHRETDLAMLALFGLPHLPRALDAYQEVHPLADGWQERQPLHQLFPLLVHAAMFGGTYGELARAAARKIG